MKKIIFGLLLLIISWPLTVLALEVDFPSVSGIKPTDSFGPADWINYIFIFALSIVGLAIIYSLVRAGFDWMTAGDNQSKITDARKRIQETIIGLLILLGSYVILYTINPDLVTLKRDTISVNVGKSYGALQIREDGESCYDNIECKSEKCDKTVSGGILQGVCGGLGSNFPLHSRYIGQTCNSGADCISGYCYASPNTTNKICQESPSGRPQGIYGY